MTEASCWGPQSGGGVTLPLAPTLRGLCAEGRGEASVRHHSSSPFPLFSEEPLRWWAGHCCCSWGREHQDSRRVGTSALSHRAPPTSPALMTAVVSSVLVPRQNRSFPSWGLREGRAFNIFQLRLKFLGCPNMRRGNLESCFPSTQACIWVMYP